MIPCIFLGWFQCDNIYRFHDNTIYPKLGLENDCLKILGLIKSSSFIISSTTSGFADAVKRYNIYR